LFFINFFWNAVESNTILSRGYNDSGETADFE